MDDDDQELVQRLFVVATTLIETAHEAAIAGQSGEIAAGDYAEAARRLQATARDIAVIIEAAIIVANPSIDQSTNRLENLH